jgi:WG containing repeat
MLLIRRFILLFSVLLVPYLSKAQFVSERSAINKLEKGKWDKAKSQLSKILLKDSVRAGAEYALSRYFFSESNPDFHIDSAYTHIQRTLSDYQQATKKEREKLLKLPLDSIVIINYRKRIDSAAFEQARQTNTEVAYLDFLKRFESAEQKGEAIALRDEVAYSAAVKENTYTAFLKYLEKYPESVFSTEAKARYERLLFESKTQDQKLATFESFLMQYPETPYRREIEQQIFEKITVGGDAASFDRFIRKYATSSRTQQAKNILYHLLKEDERALMPTLAGDSIRKVQALEKHYLVPFLKDDKFGFMNEHGVELINPTLKEISDDYLCGNVTDELLIADDKIITRNGAVLYRGKTSEIEQLGYGFLLIDGGSCSNVLHVSGFMPEPGACLQDAKLLAKNYLLLKKDNHWSVWTLTGRMLISYEWDDIQLLGEVIAFKRASKLRLVRLKELAKIAEQHSPTFSKEYDEVKLWNDGLLWVRNGSEQAVLTQSLNEWIKAGRQQISPAFFGAVGQSATGYVLHDRSSGASPNYYQVKIQKPWVAVQQEGTWHQIDLATKKLNKESYDSVSFVGPFFLAMKKDSLQIQLTKTSRIQLPKAVRTNFIPGKDSLFFLMLEEGDKKVVYNTKAERLFTLVADKLEYNNENYFTITIKQRKGLISMAGKIVLPPEYDGVGTVTDGKMATLKDKKFGLIDLVHKKSIKPEYDKNVTSYDKSRLIAFKGNTGAFIGWDNKPITPFEFEEIRYWNDSSAIVKKNFQWLIYNFIEKRIVVDKIKGYKWVNESADEKIMIVQQENKYGVFSSTRGMIIPATFSDIVNVGSTNEPLYFTEKHVEEASIFIVIYYDMNGVQLRKYVYEGEDYEKIYCSGK